MKNTSLHSSYQELVSGTSSAGWCIMCTCRILSVLLWFDETASLNIFLAKSVCGGLQSTSQKSKRIPRVETVTPAELSRKRAERRTGIVNFVTMLKVKPTCLQWKFWRMVKVKLENSGCSSSTALQQLVSMSIR